jgi:transposase-like protein
VSFYFNFNAENKSAAKSKAAAEMANVVLQQPIHAKDEDKVLRVVEAYLNLIPEPDESECVYMTVSGSLSWRGEAGAEAICGATVSVSCSNAYKPKAAA